MRLHATILAAAAAAVAMAREPDELECTPYTDPLLLDKGLDVEVCQGPWLDKDGLPILDEEYGTWVHYRMGEPNQTIRLLPRTDARPSKPLD